MGPFPSRPILGSIRGEGAPPTNPSRHLRKKGETSLLSDCSRKIEGDRPPPPPPLLPSPLLAAITKKLLQNAAAAAHLRAAAAQLPPLPLFRSSFPYPLPSLLPIPYTTSSPQIALRPHRSPLPIFPFQSVTSRVLPPILPSPSRTAELKPSPCQLLFNAR